MDNLNSQISANVRAPCRHPPCTALIDASTKDLYRNNAFRVTGLPVDSTPRQVVKHCDKLKLLAELGHDLYSDGAPLRLHPQPTLSQIREAVERLKDPEKRLIDEFFWFWPEDLEGAGLDPGTCSLVRSDLNGAIRFWTSREGCPEHYSVATHNLALLYHILALDWEHEALQTDLSDWQRKQVSGYWKEGLDRWKKLVADEAIWVRVENRIRQLNEPTLRTSLAREMRAALPTALRQINAKLALAFATSGKKPQSSIHIALLRDSASADGACESDIEVALGPLRRGLDEQIKCAKNHRPDGTTTSLCAAQRLLEFARRTLDLFDHFLIRREVNSELFDEVAVVCNQLQAAHHKATSDNKACIDILNAALGFATAVEVRARIEKNCATLAHNLTMEQLGPIYVTLNRIQEAKEGPRERLGEMTKSLPLINSIVARLTGCKEQCDHLRDSVAVVLRGICLDAWNTHQDIGTALAANRQAVQFAVGQELAQRLQDDQTALDRIVRDRIRAAEREEVTKLLSEINRSGVEPPPKKERRI